MYTNMYILGAFFFVFVEREESVEEGKKVKGKGKKGKEREIGSWPSNFISFQILFSAFSEFPQNLI